MYYVFLFILVFNLINAKSNNYLNIKDLLNNKKIISKLKYEITHLSKEQLNNLIFTYNKAYKYKLNYVLSAISWEESKFGKIPFNFSDPSAGLYHNLIPTVLKRNNIKVNKYNINKMGTKLNNDREFAFKMAMAEINFWRYKEKMNLNDTVRSYNAGYRWKKHKKIRNNANIYLNKIILRIIILKWFFKNYNIKINMKR